jgi:uncharacterized protein
MKMLLPDVNVWLALTFDSHVHHPAAKTWFDALTDEVAAFCRITQQGFLRLATNSSVFGADALKMRDAWQAYDVLRGDSCVSYTEEPIGIESIWRSHTESQSYSHKIWNDAYLAAFAEAGDFEIVTFDKGFAQYPRVSSVILS